jgi:PBP1b-binding outer membrane lipoprotein LpoB
VNKTTILIAVLCLCAFVISGCSGTPEGTPDVTPNTSKAEGKSKKHGKMGEMLELN